MVAGLLKYTLICFCLFAGQALLAQGHLFSRVSADAGSVYIGQPVEVSVSVHTSTWFTKGVNPGNIKVNDAFTIYFRSVNSTERINGKTYAGVKMIFHVFPYKNKDITFPSLEIDVESPKEGTSKGVAGVIKTKPLSIKVKPVPQGFPRDTWMVSPDVSVSENWIGNLRQVKVGDVLERNITIDAQWLVAELIPPIFWDTIPGISIYPSRALVNNNKTKTSISASRTDGVKYLFEKEGKVKIPEQVVAWWNPKLNRLQKRTLKSIEIEVLPNPDLGMLESIKDSLQTAMDSKLEESEEESAFLLFGFTLKQLLIAVVVLALFLFALNKTIPPLIANWKNKREKYRNSELYYFRKFLKALHGKDKGAALKLFYQWLDNLELQEPTVHYFVKTYGTKELMEKFKLNTYDKDVSDFKKLPSDKKQWQLSRLKYVNHKKNKVGGIVGLWINP